jgi:hypothetical protein
MSVPPLSGQQPQAREKGSWLGQTDVPEAALPRRENNFRHHQEKMQTAYSK